MNITKSTAKYENWLSENTRIVEPDLELKHQSMADNPFSFFRATFYRWIQLFYEVCEIESAAPEVLGVGDLHIENFGTWRDLEGRLVWGLNDFDEAYYQPYTNDLIRLSASAHLAINTNNLKLAKEDACESILSGYADGLNKGGKAYVLNQSHKWLYDTARFRLKEPVKFWDKLNSFEEIKKGVPEGLTESLLETMPGHSNKYKVVQRIAGLGSLGRQRITVISDWNGGSIAREAKAYLPSAFTFVNKKLDKVLLYQEIIDNAVRCRDPYLTLKKKWIMRRIAPDCSRIELSSLPEEHDEQKLLYAMGWETANVHLGSGKMIKNVRKHFEAQPKGWLHAAAEKMLAAMNLDFEEWKKEYIASKKAEQ